MFLLGVNAALFVIGMFIETSAAIIVLAPILAPVAVHFGIDPVHFGLIMVVNLALGMITPPFGVNLFAACTVARISLDRIVTQLIPFVLVVLACLMVITYVPGPVAGPARPGVREVSQKTQRTSKAGQSGDRGSGACQSD
jgi:C4-dicarboxylate transporter DctM subunit